MNTQWKSFLTSQSAQILDNDEVRFEPAQAATHCMICDLSHFGLIAVDGEDAHEFLQGQFTNDTRNIAQDRSHMSSYCNPKGRMLANFRIFQRNETLYLQLPKMLLESVQKRLAMFVLRAKVTLKDASDDFVRIGLWGDCAASNLRQYLPKLPQIDNDVVHSKNLSAIRIPDPLFRIEVIGPLPDIQILWQGLTPHATPVNADLWELHDIQAGIPTVYPETVEAFIPQMANMQLVDGVSFTKGCYTGQEIVARMQFLGKLKRRMYLAHVDTENAPHPGDKLYSPSSDSGQGTGKLVAARATPGGGYDVLAVVEIASAERNDVHLGKKGTQLEFKELPYPFDGGDQPA